MESLERSRCNGKAHVGQANDERDRRLKVHQRLCRARKARSAAQSSTAPNRNGARTREIQRRCAGSGARWRARRVPIGRPEVELCTSPFLTSGGSGILLLAIEIPTSL